MSPLRDVPLRVRLVVSVLLLVIVALAAANIAGATALRGYLLDRVDGQLYASSRGAVDFALHPPLGDQANVQADLRTPALATAYFMQLTDIHGEGSRELRVPAGLEQTYPELPLMDPAAIERLHGKPFTAPAEGKGSRWRVLVTALPGKQGAITVATSLHDVDSTVGRLLAIDLGVSCVVLLALGIIGYLIVRSSLQGLLVVERTAKAIAEGDLAQRVPDLGARTEVGKLANSINIMLGQIESSFELQRESEQQARTSEARMRRFVADASHELRTPITSIRGFAELFRQGAVPDDEALTRLMGRVESEAQRMGMLVEDLLLLARLDQQRPLDRREVDLLAIAADIVHDATFVSADHPIALEVAGDVESTPPIVVGDEARLRQVVTNLVSNACMHTPAQTPVTVRLSVDGGDAVVEVIDAGPGMHAQDAAHVFERFYRTDLSRSREQGGTGLGLSIVAALVAAHGGTVDVQTVEGEGATFVVRLPLRPLETSAPE